MDTEIQIGPDDVMNIYRDGQKRGFMAGIIFCVTMKYLYDRRRELVPPEIVDGIRTRN